MTVGQLPGILTAVRIELVGVQVAEVGAVRRHRSAGSVPAPEAAAIAHWGAYGRWFSRRPQAVNALLFGPNLGAVWWILEPQTRHTVRPSSQASGQRSSVSRSCRSNNRRRRRISPTGIRHPPPSAAIFSNRARNCPFGQWPRLARRSTSSVQRRLECDRRLLPRYRA
jgi:hypothetical protein